ARYGERAEMLFVPAAEFRPRVRVAQAAQMLERVRGGDAADARADVERQAHGHPLHQTAAVRIADARRIDDAPRRDRRHVVAPLARDDGGSLLAARDDERARFGEDAALVEPGLLTQQLELVIVDDDERRARHPFAQLVAGHPRALLTRIENERNAER